MAENAPETRHGLTEHQAAYWRMRLMEVGVRTHNCKVDEQPQLTEAGWRGGYYLLLASGDRILTADDARAVLTAEEDEIEMGEYQGAHLAAQYDAIRDGEAADDD